MGRVYLARSPGGRTVAVKVIRANLAEDAGFRARFAREVSAARKVGGLFTAAVVDADVDGPVPWLVTAYVPGTSLSDAVERQGPLPENSVLALAAGLAEGLIAIHAAGVIHRDLKPSNVLLAQDGPRIIDFGISSAAGATSLTGTGFMIGSPGFMSPEQAEGLTVGPASDIFSLAGVLIYAARGEGPFGSGDTAALLYRVVHGKPNTDNVPENLRPLIKRSLSRDPKRRPTATQFLTDLSAAYPAAADLSNWLPAQILGENTARSAPSEASLHPPGGSLAGGSVAWRFVCRRFASGWFRGGPALDGGPGRAGRGPGGTGRRPGRADGHGRRRAGGRAGGRRRRPGRPAHPHHAVHPDAAPADPVSHRPAGLSVVAGAAGPGVPRAAGLRGSAGLSRPAGLPRSAGLSRPAGLPRPAGLRGGPAGATRASRATPVSRATRARRVTRGSQGYPGQQQYPEPQGYQTGQQAQGDQAQGGWWGGQQPGGPQPSVPGEWYAPGGPARPPRKRPKWLIPAGAAAAILVIVVALVLVLGGGSANKANSGSSAPAGSSSAPAQTHSASPQPTPTVGELQLAQLRVGDCLAGSNMQLNTSAPWPKVTKAVPCTEDHTAEVFYASDNYWAKKGGFPGNAAIKKDATAACNGAFASYVGIAYSKSLYTWTDIVPDASTWPSGDRGLHCVVYYATQAQPAGVTLHESLKGTAK